MAYSRWDKSRWFVFGCSRENIPKTDQELAIHDSSGITAHFSYSDLNKNMDSILEQIRKETGASSSEMVELRDYIQAFLRDTERNLK